MIVIFSLVASVCIVCAAGLIWSGIRLWRDPGHSPIPMGYGHAQLTAGIFCAFIATMIISTTMLQYTYHGVFMSMPKDIRWTVPISVIGTLLWTVLLISVSQFNRPRFLVPPHLRGEQGHHDQPDQA